MDRLSLKKTILQTSYGLVSTTTDLVLFTLFLPIAMIGKKSPYEINQGFEEIQKLITDINYNTLRRAFYQLSQKGHVTRTKKQSQHQVTMTQYGLRRFAEIVPAYKTVRPWDKNVYLISYDIPNNANNKRNILRSSLKRMGCALLQESLWLTPYNPTKILEDFTSDYHIPGTVLVSKLGKDGAIGKESLQNLVCRIYRLDQLVKRYDEFLTKYNNLPLTASKLTLSIEYLSILKDDPQLPFEIEPPTLTASVKKANDIYLEYLRSFKIICVSHENAPQAVRYLRACLKS